MSVIFFSSRRRHTRWPRDWSSDVCSSDLRWRNLRRTHGGDPSIGAGKTTMVECLGGLRDRDGGTITIDRSEERRVGKECSVRRSKDEEKKNRYRCERR